MALLDAPEDDSVVGPPRAVHGPFVFAALGCGVVVAAASTAFLLAPAAASPPAGFDGTPLASLVDITALRRVHQMLLLATALVGTAGLLAPRIERSIGGRVAAVAAAVLAVVFVVAIVAAGWLGRAPASSAIDLVLLGERYGLHAIPSPFWFGTAGIASCFVAALLWKVGKIPDHWAFWAAVLLYAILLALPGVLLPLDLSRTPPGTLQMVEWHYDIFLGPKNDLVRGVEPARFGYGVGLSLFAALVETVFRPSSFAGDVRLVQLGNVAFSLLAIAALRLSYRGRGLGALMASLLVLPWAHSLHGSIFFPNQSGGRFLFIPIALVTFARGHRAGAKAAVTFGFIAGSAVLWNPETGIPVFLGLASHLVSRLPDLRLRTSTAAGGLFAAGVVAACAAVAASYLALLGHPLPMRTLVGELVERMRGFPFGMPLVIDPLALVVVVSAIGAVLVGAWLRRSGPLVPAAADALGSGVIVLVWTAYYLQRSHPWNLWGHLLPFAVIAGAAWPAMSHLASRSGVSRIAALAGAAFAFGAVFAVGPAILASNVQSVTSLYRAASPIDPSPGVAEFSGVFIRASDEAWLSARLAFLDAAPSGTLAFTGNSYLLPKLVGRRDLFWLPDPAFGRRHDGGATEREHRAVIEQVRARSPTLILFDDATVSEGDGFHRGYFAALQAELRDQYRPDSERSGWSAWRKLEPPGEMLAGTGG